MAKMQYHTIREYEELLERNGLLLEANAEESTDQVIRMLTYNSKEAGKVHKTSFLKTLVRF